MSKIENLLPRLIRLRDISRYLGMDRHRFNEDVRPLITEVPIGKQGKAFDRYDLDNWVDHHKDCSGKPPTNTRLKLWEAKHRDSTSAKTAGISTKQFSDAEFARALKQTYSQKPKDI